MRDQAIYETHPNVISYDEEHGCFDKNGDLVKIDESLVKAKLTELQAEYESKKYQRDRAIAYPSITDVVVALAEKEEGDDTMWKEISAKRQKVKADNPKPE